MRKHSSYAFRWFENREQEQAYFTDYEKLYSRVFPVYNGPQKQGDFMRNVTLRGKRRYFRNNKDRPVLTLKFFPEGGGLVDGLTCRVAFEAAWDDGRWADGWLHYGQDSVRAENRGRGVFTLTPEMMKNNKKVKLRFVAVDGTIAEASLPEADSVGVVVRVEQDGNSGRWHTSVQSSSNLPADRLALTLMHEGRLLDFARVADLKPNHEAWQYDIADSLLTQPGIYQITVFDGRGYVYADRLFFAGVNQRDKLSATVSVQGLKDKYAPYEPVSLRVKAAETDGYVSLAVRDDERRDYLYDNGNILTEMLLSSEIRGFVPSPGWYFERDDQEHRAALDLLMMTQGWRRFRWQDMAVRGAWELTQPAEQAPLIKGEVYANRSDRAWQPDGVGADVLHPDLASHFLDDLDASNVTDGFAASESSRANGADRGLEQTQQDGRAEEQDPQILENEKKQNDDVQTDEHDKSDRKNLFLRSEKDVKLHTELVSMDGKDAVVDERATNKGRFQIQLPPFYGSALLFLSAADTTGWKEHKQKNYEWIQGKPYDGIDLRASNNKFRKERFDVRSADFIARVQWPYPRFVSPYTYYQTTLARDPDADLKPSLSGMAENTTHHLNEVSIGVRHNGMRGFDDSQPCLIMDADEAANYVFDAGMDSWARYVVADYGLENPFISNGAGRQNGETRSPVDNMYVRAGISASRRLLPPYSERFTDVPKDSLYTRKYLFSYHRIPSRGELVDYIKGMEKIVLYTDYDRRLPGNWRYRDSNLPVTTMVFYPYEGPTPRMRYRDRRYVLQGFSYPAEFYSPDYSRGKLPKTPKDYRRTLYWNPNLPLDQNGESVVRFYNCARQTAPSVDVQGQTREGVLLWNAVDR